MKLLRWTLAGASFYVIYKYGIGKKAKGEAVFESPDSAEPPAPPAAEKPARPKRPRKKTPPAK
jgi:hypothetical protein